MKLLKRKVEFFTGIQLKSFSRWLINKDWLKEQQKIRRQGSDIVISFKEEAEAKKLYILGLWFREAVKVKEKYWNAGPGLVYMICCSIEKQRIRSCKGRS